MAEYFEEAAQGVTPKTAANFILGQIFRRLVTDADKEACEVSVPAAYLRELVALIDSGKLKMNLAKSTLEKMLDTGKPVGELLTEEDMAGVDEGALRALCEEVAAANPSAVADYRGGKEKALKALLGARDESHPRRRRRANRRTAAQGHHRPRVTPCPALFYNKNQKAAQKHSAPLQAVKKGESAVRKTKKAGAGYRSVFARTCASQTHLIGENRRKHTCFRRFSRAGVALAGTDGNRRCFASSGERP